MACAITIDLNSAKLIQDTAGDPPSSIQVGGAADGCDKVTVFLVGQNPTSEVTVEVIDGAWLAVFNAPLNFSPDDFPCGVKDVKITAYCTDDESCREDTAIPVLNCTPRDCPPQATCIVYRENDPNDLVDLTECLSPGSYTVLITDPVTPAAFYQWSLNGVTQPAASGNGQNSFQITLVSGDGPQTVSAGVILSPSCFLLTGATLLVCEEQQPEECPAAVTIQVSRNNVSVTDLTSCLTPGDYTLTVSNPTGNNVSYGWSVDNIFQPGETGASFNFTLPAGETHAVQVSAARSGCPPVPGSVTLTGCEEEHEPGCANEITWLVVNDQRQPVDLEAGCLPPGRYTVVVQDPTGPDVTFTWILNGLEQVGENQSTFSIVLAEGGNAEIGVIVQDSHCPEMSARFTLTGCDQERECPEQVTLIVTDSSTNPVDPDDCLQPGNYSIRVSQPSGAGVTFTWSIAGQVQAGETGSSISRTLGQQNNLVVAVRVTPPGCPPLPAGVTLTPCQDEDDDDDDDEVELPPPPAWCPWLLLSGLAAFLIGLVLIWAGFCTGNVPLAVTGGILAVIGIGLLIAWAFLCGTKRGGCRIFARLLQLLSILTIILGIVSAIFGAIAAVCAVVTSPGVITEIICAIPGACGLGAVIDFVLSGFLLGILTLIFVQVCTDLTSPNSR